MDSTLYSRLTSCIMTLVFYALLLFGLQGTASASSPNDGTSLDVFGRSFSMEDTIKDLYDPPEVEPRFFFNFDQTAAFNTSVAFTIPLFSFTLPGASASSAAGIAPETFGSMAFVALFILGGLGVAIYTTTQGAAGRRAYSSNGNTWEETTFLNTISNLIQDSVYSLPEVFDTGSCARLAVCGAHADDGKYGYLALPLKLLAPSRPDAPLNTLSTLEKAARFGKEHVGDECYFEYPCLVQPMDLTLYVYDYLFNNYHFQKVVYE